MDIKKRIGNVFSKLDSNVEAIIIKNYNEQSIDNNFFYFTGLKEGLFEGCAAILYPDNNVDLLVSELEEESAKKSGANIFLYNDKESFNKILSEQISSKNFIGLNFNGLMFKDFLNIESILPNVKFFDISEILMKIRLIKDEIEIKSIRKACEIADIVINRIPEFLHDGIFEYELAAEIDYLMQKNGASKPAFGTISSFGSNTSEPHYSHGDFKLRYGDFVLCDFGACFDRYNSDITRTFIFGKSSDKQKKMFDTVYEAQKVAFDNIKSGVKAKDVHKSVFDFIEKTDFKGRFIHSTGHSLGLNVHDGIVGFNSICEEELKENMVFTVEPGVYIPEFGGVRIEDDILVKKDGIEILTKANRDLIEIE